MKEIANPPAPASWFQVRLLIPLLNFACKQKHFDEGIQWLIYNKFLVVLINQQTNYHKHHLPKWITINVHLINISGVVI